MRSLLIFALTLTLAIAMALDQARADACNPATSPSVQTFDVPPGDGTFRCASMTIPWGVTVKFNRNATNTPVTLRQLELRTLGPGAYSIRTGSTPVTKTTIRANGSTNIALSLWGRSTGGYLRSEEPVTVQGIAYFEAPGKRSFVKQFIETFRP